MTAIQHVFRRGAIYWWRRRLFKKCGESGLTPVAISLGTSEVHLARTIAAHLTLESDRLLRRQEGRMLSASQVKSILTSVAKDHLQKLSRVAALELADGIDASDGRRADLVMGWAMRIKAAKGPDAAIAADDRVVMARQGLLEEDIADVGRTIVALRQAHVNANTPTSRILSLLGRVGASQSAGDIVEAQRLVHRAQAAALLAVDHRWSVRMAEDENLISEVISEFRSLSRADVPDECGRLPVVQSAPNIESEVTPVALPARKSVTTVTFLSERLIGEKGTTKEWREKTQSQVRSVAALFVKMLGTDDVLLVNQAQIANYKSLLLKLPKSYGKNPRDFDQPLVDILLAAKSLPKEKVGRHGSTLNRHLTQLKAIVEYIETSGHTVGDFKGVQKLRSRVTSRPRDARAIFTEDDIRAIFSSPPWTGSRSEDNRASPGSLIIHDSLYWVPLLAKATLGRREELCGLDVDDVDVEDGIDFIHIRPKDNRLLKNDQSNRRIPLIGEICRLGFIGYRDAVKRLGYRLLFPELRAVADRTPFGDVFHGNWIKVQNRAVPNAESDRKSFHSFRKTSGNDLKSAGVVSELRADILGHGGQNITEERYASTAKLRQMLDALEKLPDFSSHLSAYNIRLRSDVVSKSR